MKKINGNLVLKKLYKKLAQEVFEDASKIVDDAANGKTDALYAISNGPWEVITFATIRAEEKANARIRKRTRAIKSMVAEYEGRL